MTLSAIWPVSSIAPEQRTIITAPNEPDGPETPSPPRADGFGGSDGGDADDQGVRPDEGRVGGSAGGKSQE